MTDWEIVEKNNSDDVVNVKPKKTYIMKAGDVHFYDVGACPFTS